MSRPWLLWLIAPVILVSGCRTLSQADAKAKAHRHWSTVRARVKLQLAEQQFEAGLFEDTLKTASESVALDPHLPQTYVLLARAHLALDRPKSATDVLDAARRNGLTSADLHYTRGVVLEQREQFEAAVEEYRNARQLDPNQVDYLVAEAECLVELQKPGEAFRLLEENDGRFNEDGTLAALTAYVALLVNDNQKALDRFGKARVTNRDSRLIAEETGRLLVRAGRYEEALNILEPLVDAPGKPQAGGSVRRAVAACHLALGHPAAAKQVLADYAQGHRGDAAAQLLLAKSAVALGDWMTALRAIDLAKRHDPSLPELRLVRATARWQRGEYAAAAADLRKVLEDQPDDVEARCLLAETLRSGGRMSEARTQFQRALELDPTCAWAACGLKSLSDGKAPAERTRLR